jgi:hypothetical protein
VRSVDLIPGDPAELRWLAGRLGVLAGGLGETAQTLSAIDAHEWTGPAAEAFRRAVELQPGRYSSAAESFAAASRGVAGYANVLEAAQQDAGRAISTHQEADSATAAWHQRQQQAAQDAAAQAKAHPHQAVAQPQLGGDPGDAGRAQAETLLTDARLAVEAAAARLRLMLADVENIAPRRPGQTDAYVSQAELKALKRDAGAVGYGATVLEGLLGGWKPLKVPSLGPEGADRIWIKVGSGSKQVLGHLESFGWQEGAVKTLKIGGVAVAGGAGFLQQWAADGGKYPLGAKLGRSTTAAATYAGGAVVAGLTSEGIVGSSLVSGLIPEVGIAIGVPGLGEIVVIGIVAIGIGWAIDKYALPVVDKELFAAEHWATHEGAPLVAGAARAELRGYEEEGRAVVTLGRDGVHLAGEGLHDVSSAASAAKGTAGHALHGLGSAAESTVSTFKSGFGLFGH